MWGSRYRSARAGLEQMLRVVRRVAGMPDYAAHVEHRISLFGRGQIIRRLANGAYVVGSEPRAEGCAVGF